MIINEAYLILPDGERVKLDDNTIHLISECIGIEQVSYVTKEEANEQIRRFNRETPR